jgi:CBS domain-containing protein
MTGISKFKEIMQTDVKTARPCTSEKRGLEKMNRFNVGSIVIVGNRMPVGIITERDVLQRVVEHCIDPRLCKAKDVMTSRIVTATDLLDKSPVLVWLRRRPMVGHAD